MNLGGHGVWAGEAGTPRDEWPEILNIKAYIYTALPERMLPKRGKEPVPWAGSLCGFPTFGIALGENLVCFGFPGRWEVGFLRLEGKPTNATVLWACLFLTWKDSVDLVDTGSSHSREISEQTWYARESRMESMHIFHSPVEWKQHTEYQVRLTVSQHGKGKGSPFRIF